MSDLPKADAGPHKWQRRHWMALGGIAALAGAGVGWWQSPRIAPGPVPSDGWWSHEWPQPSGGVLSMQSFKGRKLLLNVWATWCPPCVEELPLLEAFFVQHRQRGWQVLGVAADQISAVQNFLKRVPLSFPIAVAGADGLALAKALGNTAGALPFTVIVDEDGQVLARKLGQVSADDLKLWAESGA